MKADFAFPSLRSILLLPVLVSLATACGGGGDDDDDGPDVPDADATGVYRGTATPDGGTSSPANLIVAPGGQFQLVTSVALFAGTGTTDGMEFSANATGYAPTGTSFPSGATTGSFSLMGTVVEQSRVSGTFSGAGLSGRVSLDFDATVTNRPASLQALAGSYQVQAPPGAPSASFAITSSGVVTSNSSDGCVGNGNFQVIQASVNIYSWSVTFSSCPVASQNGTFTGLAFMPTDNLLVVSGNSSAAGLAFSATK